MSKHLRVVLVLAGLLIACAEDKAVGEQKLSTLPKNAEAAAQEILGDTLAFHSVVHAVYGRVKGELKANPDVLLDELVREPWMDSTLGLWGTYDVENELGEVLQGTDWEHIKLNARASSALDLFSSFVAEPRAKLSQPLKEIILDNLADSYWDLAAVLTSTGSVELENAYHFAPMFNIIASARIIALATQGYGVESLEEIYAQTIEIDERLVGSSVDNLGTLSDYIASRFSGTTASAREKNEADPIAYTIRRMIGEQRAALEQ